MSPHRTLGPEGASWKRMGAIEAVVAAVTAGMCLPPIARRALPRNGRWPKAERVRFKNPLQIRTEAVGG